MDNRILELAEKIYVDRVEIYPTDVTYMEKAAKQSFEAAKVFYEVKKEVGK